MAGGIILLFFAQSLPFFGAKMYVDIYQSWDTQLNSAKNALVQLGRFLGHYGSQFFLVAMLTCISRGEGWPKAKLHQSHSTTIWYLTNNW